MRLPERPVFPNDYNDWIDAIHAELLWTEREMLLDDIFCVASSLVISMVA